jgi:hypothetical protein
MMVIAKPINLKREETTMKITTIGLDLAKSVFHVVCFNEHSKKVKNGCSAGINCECSSLCESASKSDPLSASRLTHEYFIASL